MIQFGLLWTLYKEKIHTVSDNNSDKCLRLMLPIVWMKIEAQDEHHAIEETAIWLYDKNLFNGHTDYLL